LNTLPTNPAAIDILQQLSALPLQCHDKEAAQRVVDLTRLALHSQLCTLVHIDTEKRRLTQLASATTDERAAHSEHWEVELLPTSHRRLLMDFGQLAQDQLLANYDLLARGQGIVNPALIDRLGLQSVLCCPFYSPDRQLFSLNHFVTAAGRFSTQDRELLALITRQAATVLALVERMPKAAGYDSLQLLNSAMQELTRERNIEKLMEAMLDRAIELVGAERGWVSQLELSTGELQIVAQRGDPPARSMLSIGQGITGKALAAGCSLRVDRVDEPPWKEIYVAYWPDTVAELAVPIIGNAEVRIGAAVKQGPKPIGVLNLESPRPAAFSSADESLLQSLTSHAAILLDRLDLDRKWAQLTKVQQQIIGRRDWNSIINDMLQTITATLGYSYVNISMVDERLQRIHTTHVIGMPDNQVELFKRLADHALDSNDIQADIVRTRRIEVPALNDPRFDPEIHQRFNHASTLRVFMPLIAPSTDQVIGTVEAGHMQSKRTHIYEHDVQILKGFVDYAVRALEQRQRGQMERITHELRSPVVGIRSNTSYLQRRLRTLAEEFIQRKFGDILADCEILLHQIADLEFTLGQQSREAKIERTLVFRDVVIKTVTQLRPLVVSQLGGDPNRIIYDLADIRRIKPLYLDRGHLNQVVFNLLHNAIKYAEDDPAQFTIQIKVEDRPKDYVLVFKDWGIGIHREYINRVFEEGFRTPEALQKTVTGYGLGLSISKRLMQQIGGDLRLANHSKPTEFQVILPKTLAEAPNDYDG
jgi:signal transduction histidine kinase/putative methionine-R-sulfoxide reductase with GAF domain